MFIIDLEVRERLYASPVMSNQGDHLIMEGSSVFKAAYAFFFLIIFFVFSFTLFETMDESGSGCVSLKDSH